MSREAIRKLLGGYAAGTLTADERQALFEAALDDQELFDELAREQPLRDLLGDPAARAYLLAALDKPSPIWHRRLTGWAWGHALGMAAVACFVAVGGYVAWQARFRPVTMRFFVTQPVTVEVKGSAETPAGPARPRRAFDAASLKQPPAPPPKLPPPPPAEQMVALAQPPALFLPQAIPPPPPPPAAPVANVVGGIGGQASFQAGAVTALRAGSNPGATAAMGARGGSGGGGGGGGGGRPAPRPARQAAAAAQAPSVGAEAPKPPATGKFAPAIAALVERVRSGASPSVDEARFVTGGEAYVQLTLADFSAESLDQLRNAGLTITRQDGGVVTGHIPPAKLEALSQFPFVLWIAPQ
ncbi:MAG: hypothetical protein ABSC23_04245 [Bryobacteraceae bacterium]|jgi:hypothetical protein